MVKKLISVFLAAVIAVTGLTVSASAYNIEWEIFMTYKAYELLGLVRANSTDLDVTNHNVLEDQVFNRIKASGSLTVFAPYRFTLKQKDTIEVTVKTTKDFISNGVCAFVFDSDDQMFYDYNDSYFVKTSKFDSNTYTFTVEDLPKGRYYLIFAGASNTKGKFTLDFTAKKSLEDKPKVTATALGNEKVKLKWKKIEGATKYRICKLVGGKFKTIKKSTKKTSYTVTGLTKGNIYNFGVQAYVNGKWTTLTLKEAVDIKVE